MEAAVVNHVAAGERVLVINIGEFGQRFVDLVRNYGAEPVELKFEYGQAADPAQVEDALKANRDVRTVLITHNETSTGTTNVFLPQVAEVAHRYDCLLIVDAISVALLGPREDRRVGPRRRALRVAEGVDGRAGPGVRLGQRARLGAAGAEQDAALLLRPAPREGLAGEGRDAVDAGGVAVLPASTRRST